MQLNSFQPKTKSTQSLTGSIHTQFFQFSFLNLQLFQSLTGSIHTPSISRKIDVANSVSIPHRFNSHFDKNFWGPQILKSFNPSQVQFTQKIIFIINPSRIEFQSLTGSIHTVKQLYKQVCMLLVSIPHRFNSHKI